MAKDTKKDVQKKDPMIEVQKLIEVGKQKGILTYGEVMDAL
ncbi:MAG: RNA polymerase sigma factor RpoD, partial [Clostridia bacterium]|nr:RNA polymerase sigma factor RpoD [Clostridia bacterium]